MSDAVCISVTSRGKCAYDEVANGDIVYVGHKCTMDGWKLPQTKWRNPYKVGKDGNTIDEVLDKYQQYIRSTLWNDLNELYDKVLGCFCKIHDGEQCHACTLVLLCEEKQTLDAENNEVNTSDDAKSLDIHFDGSALLDEAAGYAFILCVNDKKIYEEDGKIDASDGRMTSPRAELIALLKALRYISHNISPRLTHINVYGDNEYVINSCNKWLQRWIENDWRKANNKSVSNRDLLEQINRYIIRIRKHVVLRFEHVFGHTKYTKGEMHALKWNRYVDKLSKYDRVRVPKNKTR